jgi:uncharacterized protein
MTESRAKQLKISGRQSGYDKKYLEKGTNRRNKSRKDSQRQRYNRLFAQFGMKCIEVGEFEAALSEIDDNDVTSVVNEYIMKVHGIRRSSRRSKQGHQTTEREADGSYPACASECANCRGTCGIYGCSDQCICFAEKRICVHTNKYYFCAATPHRQYYAKVKVVFEEFFPKRGKCSRYGLQSVDDVKEGGIIGEYTGERVIRTDVDEVDERLSKADSYLIDANECYIDGATGNEMRYINSSCLPNVEFQKFEDESETRIFIRALRDIKAGEMLYVSYGWSTSSKPVFIKCLCRLTESCRLGLAYL